MFVPIIKSFLIVFDTIVYFYTLTIILAVVASWLIVFGVLSMHNQLARSLVNMLDALTEPVFRRVRRFLPAIGGIDLSPIVVLVALQVLQTLVDDYAYMLMR